jgi:hypothetical protein
MTIIQRKIKLWVQSSTLTKSTPPDGDSYHHVGRGTASSIFGGGDGLVLQAKNYTSATQFQHSSKKRIPIPQSSLTDMIRKKVSNNIVSSLGCFLFASVLIVQFIQLPLFLNREGNHQAKCQSKYMISNNVRYNKPRLVYLEINNRMNNSRISYLFHEDKMLRVFAGEESVMQSDEDDIVQQSHCIPMSSWQTMSYPTCNIIHEINLEEFGEYSFLQLSVGSRRKQVGTSTLMTNVMPYSFKNIRLMGQGWYRQTWKVDASVENFVLKTLRYASPVQLMENMYNFLLFPHF